MSQEDLLSKITSDVAKTGFPLELRVSAVFAHLEYWVANNLYYIDEDESKGREIDLRALRNISWNEGESTLWLRHCFLVECKKSSKPWVIFCSKPSAYDLGSFEDLHGRGFRKPVIEYFEEHSFFDTLVAMMDTHPLLTPARIGRSYYEAFSGNEEGGAIFRGLTTAVKATLYTRSQGFFANEKSFCYYYPLIVLEGRLFEAYYEGNELKVEETQRSTISFNYTSTNYLRETFSVPVVTEAELEPFLVEIQAVQEVLAKSLRGRIELT